MRETLIHLQANAVWHFLVAGIGHHILLSQLMHTPESQKGFKANERRRMRLLQRHPHQDLILLLHHKNFRAQYHSAHPVYPPGGYLHVVTLQIFVPLGFVVAALVLMYAQIKHLLVLYQRQIQRRQQNKAPSPKMGYGTNQHSVVLSGVAANNRCAAIGAGTIGAQNFTMQRILQIHQLGLVKVEISHTILNYKKIKSPGSYTRRADKKTKQEATKTVVKKYVWF